MTRKTGVDGPYSNDARPDFGGVQGGNILGNFGGVPPSANNKGLFKNMNLSPNMLRDYLMKSKTSNTEPS